MNEPFPSELPGLRPVGVPQRFRSHPLLTAGPYFTLPTPLLQQVLERIGAHRFDAELLAMENTLSKVCQDHSSQIGFWGGQPINFLLLRPKGDLADDFLVNDISALLESSVDETWATLDLSDERLDWVAGIQRGYCGWLMTNRTFLDEHQQIFEDWKEEVAQDGIPNMSPVVRHAHAIPDTQHAESRADRFIRCFEDFFIRWRLDGMSAPFVPQPMGIQLPVTDLRPVLGHMRGGGTTFYFPDTCPVPSRDTFRKMLEDALRTRNGPEHLGEWLGIVHSENAAKTQISRYARMFELQHYFRAIYARHSMALRRKKSALTTALAEYLRVSDDTVERDLSFIAGRLGDDWYLSEA